MTSGFLLPPSGPPLPLGGHVAGGGVGRPFSAAASPRPTPQGLRAGVGMLSVSPSPQVSGLPPMGSPAVGGSPSLFASSQFMPSQSASPLSGPAAPPPLRTPGVGAAPNATPTANSTPTLKFPAVLSYSFKQHHRRGSGSAASTPSAAGRPFAAGAAAVAAVARVTPRPHLHGILAPPSVGPSDEPASPHSPLGGYSFSLSQAASPREASATNATSSVASNSGGVNNGPGAQSPTVGAPSVAATLKQRQAEERLRRAKNINRPYIPPEVFDTEAMRNTAGFRAILGQVVAFNAAHIEPFSMLGGDMLLNPNAAAAAARTPPTPQPANQNVNNSLDVGAGASQGAATTSLPPADRAEADRAGAESGVVSSSADSEANAAQSKPSADFNGGANAESSGQPAFLSFGGGDNSAEEGGGGGFGFGFGAFGGDGSLDALQALVNQFRENGIV